MKPEVKKIPKRRRKKKRKKKGVKEGGTNRTSPARKLEDSRAVSAQASKGRGKVTPGAKRVLTKAVLEAANDVGLRAKKKRPPEKKEKSSSPKPRERSR